MRSLRASLDLLIAIALALLACGASILSLDSWARVAIVVPVLLWAPGFAVLSIIFPDPPDSRAERAVYTIALSFIVIALSGVCLQLVRPLDRTSWAILIASVTLLACLISLARRLATQHGPKPRAIPYLSGGSLALFAAAVALACGSVAIAGAGARQHLADSHFTALWALPEPATGPGPHQVSIGVESHEADTRDYTLVIARRGTHLTTKDLRIAPGETWRSDLSLPHSNNSSRITVTLLRRGSVFRRVYLDDGT